MTRREAEELAVEQLPASDIPSHAPHESVQTANAHPPEARADRVPQPGWPESRYAGWTNWAEVVANGEAIAIRRRTTCCGSRVVERHLSSV
jgi:hypothetical protein